MADAEGIETSRESRKTAVCAQKREPKARAPFPGISCRQNQDHLKNKTATSSSEKQNAVLTLPRDANYNSCRTQNSSRTEFGVDVAAD
jgi:hypothetical protein